MTLVDFVKRGARRSLKRSPSDIEHECRYVSGTMPHDFSLADSLSLADLQVFLGRAARVEDGSVRLQARNDTLAVYVGIFYPSGLLDESPTVLGLRTFGLTTPADFDSMAPVRSLLERIARVQSQSIDATAEATVTVPDGAISVTWAAISPPRGGWSHVGSTTSVVLERAARAGIEEVAAAIPSGTGEQIVQRVRGEVWGRPVGDAGAIGRVPAGGAFAAFSLGFLHGDDEVSLHEAGPWTRLSSARGHVLIKWRRGR